MWGFSKFTMFSFVLLSNGRDGLQISDVTELYILEETKTM